VVLDRQCAVSRRSRERISESRRWGRRSCKQLSDISGNISETRKDRGKIILWRAYRNSPTSFERYHPRPPTASPSPRLGVRNLNPKLQSLSEEREKVYTDCKFGRYIDRVHPNKSPWKIWEKKSVGVSRDCPFFQYPHLRNG